MGRFTAGRKQSGGRRASVKEDEKVAILEMDGGDDCTTCD